MRVTACIVTRGDQDLTDIFDSIPPEWEVSVWDNALGVDLAVLGRYAAIRCARSEAVYVQDDDCVLDRAHLRALADHYDPEVLTANMPIPFRQNYSDSCLIGFGAIFHRELPDQAFTRMEFTPEGFQRTCDVFFTALTENQQWMDIPYRNLEWATADYRMYRQSSHTAERTAALELARSWR